MKFYSEGKLTLVVENIGGLHDRDKFSFNKGLNLITAPNAAGKSSLIHGLQALVLEEKDLSTKDYFLHSFEHSGRAELTTQKGDKWVRRIRTKEGGLSIGGEPLYPEGKKASLFCIAGEDNELIERVKSGKPLRSTLLDFSDYKYYELLSSYFNQEKQKGDQELGQYKDQLAELKTLYAQLHMKEEELEKFEKEREGLPPIALKKIAKDEEATRKLTEANEELIGLIHKITEKEGERQRVKNTFKAYSDQERRLKQEVGRFESEHPDIEKELKSMSQQIQNWESEIEELRRQMDKEQDKLEDTNIALSHYLTYGEEECFACGSSITPTQLRKRQKDLEKEIKEIGDDIVNRQDKQAALKQKRQQLENDWTLIRTDLRKRLNEASRTIALSTNQEEKLGKEIDQLLKQRSKLSAKVKTLEATADKNLQKLLHQKRDIDEKIARTDENIKTFKASIGRLGDVRTEIDRFQEEIGFLEQASRYSAEKAEEAKQAVKNEFNKQIAEVYKLLQFGDFERIYLDDNFDIKIIRRFRGQKKQDSILTLSRGEKETVGMVLMLAGREKYVNDFPMFIADETTFYDRTRFKRIIDYIAKRASYTIVTNLVPMEKQKKIKIEHTLSSL